MKKWEALACEEGKCFFLVENALQANNVRPIYYYSLMSPLLRCVKTLNRSEYTYHASISDTA